MEDLTFGEQVKIILNRKGMTIKELAEQIQERTGKAMSRQNLTQRLGRDNFQEKDMRMIAAILGCPFHLSIFPIEALDGKQPEPMEEVLLKYVKSPRVQPKKKKKEAEEDEYQQVFLFDQESEKEAEPDQPASAAGSAAEKEKAALAAGNAAGREKSALAAVNAAGTDKSVPAAVNAAGTDKSVSAAVNAAGTDKSVSSAVKKTGSENLDSAAARTAHRKGVLAQEERDITIGEIYELHEELNDLEETQEKEGIRRMPPVPKESRGGSRGKGSRDFEPVVYYEDAPEDLSLGEMNPYTGREYQTNSVRMHPSRIGYVQVYDRARHGWTDMTEWAFLGYQERKKALLGRDYEPPIYLD